MLFELVDVKQQSINHSLKPKICE